MNATLQVQRVDDNTTWDAETLSDAIGMIAGFYAGVQKIAVVIDPFVDGVMKVQVVWFIATPVEFQYTISQLE